MILLVGAIFSEEITHFLMDVAVMCGDLDLDFLRTEDIFDSAKSYGSMKRQMEYEKLCFVFGPTKNVPREIVIP